MWNKCDVCQLFSPNSGDYMYTICCMYVGLETKQQQ